MIDKATLDGMTTADAAKSKRWADTANISADERLHGHATHGTAACSAGVEDIINTQFAVNAMDCIPEELLTASKWVVFRVI